MTSEALALYVGCRQYIFTARTMPWRDVYPSVCPSVRLSHTGILSKWLNIIKLFYRLVAKPFESFHTKSYDNIPTDAPVTGHRMQVKYEKIAIFDQYSLYFGNDTR